MTETMWIVRQRIEGQTVIRQTFVDEAEARSLVKVLRGIGIVELEKSCAGSAPRKYIEVFND